MFQLKMKTLALFILVSALAISSAKCRKFHFQTNSAQTPDDCFQITQTPDEVQLIPTQNSDHLKAQAEELKVILF